MVDLMLTGIVWYCICCVIVVLVLWCYLCVEADREHGVKYEENVRQNDNVEAEENEASGVSK
jgi:hypothetical protein